MQHGQLLIAVTFSSANATHVFGIRACIPVHHHLHFCQVRKAVLSQACKSHVIIAEKSGEITDGFAGSSEDVGAGTEVSLSSSCAEPLADFALGSDNFLRHQYSGLCVGVNPAAPSTIPSPPPPANGAAVESAGIGAGSTSMPLLFFALLTTHWHIVLSTACSFVPNTRCSRRDWTCDCHLCTSVVCTTQLRQKAFCQSQLQPSIRLPVFCLSGCMSSLWA